jgi:hypothetical protein
MKPKDSENKPRYGEPNAQNSEINPKAHPSGARIEKMMSDANAAQAGGRPSSPVESAEKPATGPERGIHGEMLRPSEREDRYVSPEEPAEGARNQIPDAPHRMNADHRSDADEV